MPTTAEYLNDLINQKNSLADNLNAKGVNANRNETLNSLVPKVLEISGGGTENWYDKFWDIYQQNGTRYNYNTAFILGWTDEIYNPKYPLNGIKYCSSMYSNTSITDTKQEMSFIDGFTGNLPFDSANSLKIIRTVHVTEGINYVNSFRGCANLESITFEGVIGNNIDFTSCVKLSKDSIENIIGCLSDTATGKTATFSIIAVNKAFESDTGAGDGSLNADWIELKAIKPNWEIKLL